MSDEEKGADPNAWIASFGDLITLLMTFFVLIISMSVIKMDDVVEAINNNNGLGDNIVSADLKETGFFDDEVMSKVQLLMEENELLPSVGDIELLYDAVVVFISDNRLTEVIDLEKIKNGFVIRIRTDVLFEPGDPRPKDEYVHVLDEIADLLKRVSSDVRIEGHTDGFYSENVFEDIRLSVARATSVCIYLVDKGPLNPARFGVAGYGKHRPLLPNSDEENRSKNRRVEIIIKEKGPEDA